MTDNKNVPMKGLLIKPDEKKVDWIELPSPRRNQPMLVLDAIYKALKIDGGSRLVEAVNLINLQLPHNDLMLVDEEGLLRPETRALGQFGLGPRSSEHFYVFNGRALVLRANAQGNWITPKLRRAVLLDYVRWGPFEMNGHLKPRVKWRVRNGG